MEDPQSLHSLIKKDRYQVFLMACPAEMPFSFATHPWLVVNKKGELSRWGLSQTPGQNASSWGHLHLNLLPPFKGIWMWPFSLQYFWNARLIGTVEGAEDSLAARMVQFIEASPHAYPYCYRYSLLGPNSNTYVQWVLDRFPESGLRLPWNSFGKKYRQRA